MANLDFSNKRIVKQNQLGVPIGNKIILGQLTSYNDGTAKWTYAKDTNPLIAGPGDRSTFTLFKDDTGKYNWTPTTSTSISNLATREGFTAEQVKSSLYATPQTQTVLNAGNSTNLGINEAKRLGVPGTAGKATVTGPLPSTVSGNFYGQPDATPPPGESGATSTPVASSPAKQGTNSDEVNQKNLTLTYPEDLGSTKQDVIKFTLLEYKPSGVGATKTGLGGGLSVGTEDRGKGRTLRGSVVLPIPSGISDTNACNWGEDSMNAFEAAGKAAAFKGITEGIGAGLATLGDAVQTAGNEPSTKTGIAAMFAGSAMGGDGANLLKRAEGSVINPNMELLFNAPTLRPFSFTFKMSARSDTEAKAIIKIIRFFKRGMSPIKTESNIFLKTPNTFSIQYLLRGPGGKDHPFIGRIKECALQNFTVNYTPEGQYATFYDGPMVSYEMQMQFTELEPVFNSDYKDIPETEIGY